VAERIRFDDTIKRVFDANLQAYEGLSRVTAEYLQALARVWVDAGTTVLGRATAVPSPAGPAHGAAHAGAPSPPPIALVLEAEAGQVAQGVVMVENRLARRVEATVVTSAFSSGTGDEIRPTLRVQPGTVTLEPGGRALVQVGALVDERLAAGVGYQGSLTVPGLSDTPIPVMLRRRASQPVESVTPPSAAGQAKGTAPLQRRKRARRPKT
jgi:hypothetical protein